MFVCWDGLESHTWAGERRHFRNCYVSQGVASSHSTVQGKVQWVPKDRDGGGAVNWRESDAVPYSLRLRIGREGPNLEWLGLGWMLA